jgi:Tol biopolymer transport system component
LVFGAAAIACGSDSDGEPPFAPAADSGPGDGRAHDARADASADGAVVDVDASADGAAVDAHDATIVDAEAGLAEEGGQSDASDAASRVDAWSDAADAFDAADASDASDALRDADSSDVGAPLGDVCTPVEWAALASPLVVVRLYGPSEPWYVIADQNGQCRRVLHADQLVVSPDGRRVAYRSTSTQALWLVSSRTIDTPEMLLPSGGALGSFSPDGAWIDFEQLIPQDAGSPIPDRYVAKSDAIATRRLIAHGLLELAWSPDSKQLAFRANDAHYKEVRFDCPDRDCARATPVIPPSGVVGLTWSPDSSRVAAVTATTRGEQLVVINAATASPLQITHDADPDQVLSGHVWSPAGDKLAFARVSIPPAGAPWRNRDIVVVCADGSCRHPLASPLGQGRQGAFAWGPNGARMAFVSQTVNGEPHHVFAACPDGSCSTDLGEATELLWSKGGPYLYVLKQGGRTSPNDAILALCPDGSCSHRLGSTMRFSDGSDRKLSHGPGGLAFKGNDSALYATFGTAAALLLTPNGEYVRSFEWTVDDRAIAYEAYDVNGTPQSVQVVCVDGSCRSTILTQSSTGARSMELVATLRPPSP